MDHGNFTKRKPEKDRAIFGPFSKNNIISGLHKFLAFFLANATVLAKKERTGAFLTILK